MDNDIGGMLGAILSDPSAMAQIAALAGKLGPTLGANGVKPPANGPGGCPPYQPPPPPIPPVPVRPGGETSAIAKCCALLEALLLFTEGERKAKIGRLLSVLKLAQSVV